MERNNRLAATRHRDLKKNLLYCLFLLLPMLVVFSSCAVKHTFEIVGFMKGMAAQLKEREAFLIESAEKPLTESQEKLLTQILQKQDGLDMVLSSQPYVAYLEEQVGTAYEDYPSYLAAVPTTEQKSTTLFALKEILPSEATDEQIQICMDFYFEFRELIVNEPGITSDSEEIKPFIEEHLVRPLMDTYPSEMSVSKVTTVIQMATVPSPMALTDRDAYRKIWLENLEVYGSREGLLRCAISTPDEFALVRSFFQDAAALEKWIRLPPEQK
jgi:hypothetical protein